MDGVAGHNQSIALMFQGFITLGGFGGAGLIVRGALREMRAEMKGMRGDIEKLERREEQRNGTQRELLERVGRGEERCKERHPQKPAESSKEG